MVCFTDKRILIACSIHRPEQYSGELRKYSIINDLRRYMNYYSPTFRVNVFSLNELSQILMVIDQLTSLHTPLTFIIFPFSSLLYNRFYIVPV